VRAQDAPLGTSSWSLELGTGLGDENTLLIGVRKHMSERSAIRFALGGTLDQAEGDGDFSSPTTPSALTDRTQQFHFYEASIQWVRYASLFEDVAAQLGIGPIVQGSRSYTRGASSIGLPTFSESENRFSRFESGVIVSLGLEWFFTRRFSLGGRAALRALIGNRDEVNVFRDSSGKHESEIEMDSKRIETRGSDILLTGYF